MKYNNKISDERTRAEKDFKEEVKNSLPAIVEYYTGLTLDTSTPRQVIKCPFHDDRHPSCEIDTGKNLYHCYSCNAGGDVITFVAAKENLNTRENYDRIVKIIAEIANIPLPGPYTSTPERPKEWKKPQRAATRPERPQPDKYIIAANIVRQSAKNVANSAFYVWLCRTFGKDNALPVLERYRVGASARYTKEPGGQAVAFPYIDIEGRCIDIKLIQYNPITGSSKGTNGRSFQWYAVAMMNKDICRVCRDPSRPGEDPHKNCTKIRDCSCKEYLYQASNQTYFGDNAEFACFGEHLLKDLPPTTKVYIVESEKSAIVASIFYPGSVWIATGGKGNLTAKKLRNLKPFALEIVPDRDAIEDWKQRAKDLIREGFRVQYCPIVEQYEGNAKDDIADILGRLWKERESRQESERLITQLTPAELEYHKQGGATDQEGNPTPWRLIMPEPDKERYFDWCQWLADRAGWREELHAQCLDCRYAVVRDNAVFSRCRKKVSEEVAASTIICKEFELK